MRIPARIYAVTFGSRASLVSRVIRKPENSMSATEMITPATGLAPAISADRFVSSPHFIFGKCIVPQELEICKHSGCGEISGYFPGSAQKRLANGPRNRYHIQ